MRQKKLNDTIDLDLHQVLTALAAKVGVPRSTVLNRLLRPVLKNAHVGRFHLMHGQWHLWEIGDSFITIGTPGCRKLRENGDQPGQLFAEVEFKRSKGRLGPKRSWTGGQRNVARDGDIRISRAA